MNNQRLSLTASHSKPFEVNSGDIVQFGVDVVENTRKEAHGCIVAQLKFVLVDADPKVTKCVADGGDVVKSGAPSNWQSSDLYRLNLYVQEAMYRDQILDANMINLQKIVDSSR